MQGVPVFYAWWSILFPDAYVTLVSILVPLIIVGGTILIAWWFGEKQCTHCRATLNWAAAVRVPDRSEPEMGEERWERSADGATAVAWERWPALDSVACTQCQGINTRPSWFNTEWLRVDDAFAVEDCPMCDGEGETPVHKRSGRVKYRARCGFCSGDGYVSEEKMNRFRR